MELEQIISLHMFQLINRYNGTPPPMEPIFKWLNGLCIDFAGSWYQSIFIVTSFIFIGLIYIVIYNMPCSKVLLTVSFCVVGISYSHLMWFARQ